MRITNKITGFARQSQGSVTILFGMATLVLFITIGLAIDSARYYNLSSKMQDALDAAALTGAKLLADEKRSNADIQKIVRRNFNATIKKAGIKTISIAPLTVTVDRAKSSVVANSRVVVRSFFGPIANQPSTVEISRTSKVIYEINKIELAMVLDITGSMLAKNKLADMKKASVDVIDELFASAVTDTSVRIAVAPYSAAVNPGALSNIVSLAPPATPCTYSWFGKGCTTSTGIDIDSCVVERTGSNAFTDAAPIGLDKLPSATTALFPSYSCPSATVLPLLGRTQAGKLKDTINGYAAVGATAGHIGTAWGWYLLSPNWSNVLTGDSKPEPYGKEGVNKSMIIMTDGLFNTAYTAGSSPTAAAQTEESYKQFKSLCDGIKAKGITVYTVGFDLSDARATGELQTCASSAGNFYDAKTGAQLKDAFSAIADKLNRLRVAS